MTEKPLRRPGWQPRFRSISGVLGAPVPRSENVDDREWAAKVKAVPGDGLGGPTPALTGDEARRRATRVLHELSEYEARLALARRREAARRPRPPRHRPVASARWVAPVSRARATRRRAAGGRRTCPGSRGAPLPGGDAADAGLVDQLGDFSLRLARRLRAIEEALPSCMLRGCRRPAALGAFGLCAAHRREELRATASFASWAGRAAA